MRKRLARFLEHFFVRFLMVFMISETRSGSNGAAREVHCFRLGRRFGIFRGGDLLALAPWWTVSLCFDKSGKLLDCGFWRNRMEPGDVRLTGKKLRRAVQVWHELRPIHVGLTD